VSLGPPLAPARWVVEVVEVCRTVGDVFPPVYFGLKLKKLQWVLPLPQVRPPRPEVRQARQVGAKGVRGGGFWFLTLLPRHPE